MACVLQATHNVHHTVVNSLDCDPDIQVSMHCLFVRFQAASLLGLPSWWPVGTALPCSQGVHGATQQLSNAAESPVHVLFLRVS